MAIAFNLPSEREATEENFSRLNRLLAELYEVLCHILVARQPGQEVQENRRDRPYSESDIERPAPPPQPCRRSASSPPLTLTLDSELEDDVFVSPRTNSGSDPFSTTNLEIFRYGSPRTPAGLLLSPRRERSFTFSVTSEKHWRDKGGTDVADGVTSTDVTDSSSLEEPYQTEKSSSESIFSSIIPDKLSGSICTAVIFMLGWKLLANKR
ncbi:PREDICTED: uncharacterized protein LOC106116870 isoform X1 [Papilio xuthus]|uniref:Uncharacterized protein LOC106116870 isoform X1 n=1 Tax=Papilio xuthus TaxID=66420 RepID=A0AAJ6Z6Q0_PAPXU|nr:PREDICTED: uncharacterized protein LOC106116870 isoform X1 [Papilio xuthus]